MSSFLRLAQHLISLDHDQFKFLRRSPSGLQPPQIDDELSADGDYCFFL